MLTFLHIRNSYCQHRSCSQSVHRTMDIITPPHHCAFQSTSLSYTIHVHYTRTLYTYTILVQLAHISLPPHFTLHRSARLAHFAPHVQHWVTSIPPPNGPGTTYARMSSCPYRCQNTVTSFTPTLPLHGVSLLWDRGHRISREFPTLVRRYLAW